MIDVKEFLKEQAAKYTEAVESYDAEVAKAKEAAREEGKLEGIEIGRGQIQIPEGGEYTQEQLSTAVKDAVANATAPMEAKLKELTEAGDKSAADLKLAQDDAEKAKADLAKLEGGVAASKAQAVEDFKRDLAERYRQQQVAESTEETGFADLLAPSAVVSPEAPVQEPVPADEKV